MPRFSLAGLSLPTISWGRPRLLLGLIDSAIGGEDAAALRYALVRGREVLDQGWCEAGDLLRIPASEVAISYLSRTSFFARADLKAAAAKPKLLALQAHRFVDSEMAFNEPFRLRLQAKGHNEGTTTVEIAAAGESAFGDIEKIYPRDRVPVTRLALAELAIAALVCQVAQGPALVFWSRGHLGLALLIENGAVRMRQTDATPKRAGLAGEADWIDFVRRTDDVLRNAARQLIPNQEVYLRLYLGELHDGLSPDLRAETRTTGRVEQDRASTAVEGKLMGLLHFKNESSDQDLLRTPELYGLQFLDPAWNWLPEDYQDRVDFHRWARPAAALAATAAALLLVYDLRQLPLALSADGDARQRAQVLTGEVEKLKARIPSAAEASSVEKQIGLATTSGTELRLDRFLPWLTRSVAPGVAIRKLIVAASNRPAADVQREGQNASANAGTVPSPAGGSVPGAEQRGMYEVEVELEAHGSYEEVQHSMAATLRQLALKLHIASSSLKYGPRANDENGEAVGLLAAKLIASGKDFH